MLAVNTEILKNECKESLPEKTGKESFLLEQFRLLSEVTKLRITALVSFTTGLGYILANEGFGINIIYPVIGIFFLACGSAALNHLQEKNLDLLMDRTKTRPLPSGKTGNLYYYSVISFFTVLGILTLLLKTNIPTLSIGLITYLWYNAVYTPLKRKSALAVIPGSLVGALPPLAGWTAAGGDITDFRILYVCFYFFLWQIPHFWLLLLVYSDDYKKGGFPVLTDIMNVKSLKIMTFLWIVLTFLISIGIPFAGIVTHSSVKIIMLIAGVLLILSGFRFIFSGITRKSVFSMFISINIFTLLIILLLSLDKIII